MFKADPNVWFGHYLDFDAIRTDRYKYVSPPMEQERLYDLKLDPYETQNVAKLPNASSVKSMLNTRLNVLKTCSGTTCK